MKKTLALLLVVVLMMGIFTACTSEETPVDSGQVEENNENKEEEDSEEIPTFRIGWNNELHTGNMHLAFEKPELFEGNDAYLRPISNQQLELVKDDKVIAIFEFTLVKGASESVTLMTQGHMDIAYGSSTAYMTAADQGLDVRILAPVQSGGVSIVGDIDAEYNNFDELVEYAKNTEIPLKAGYHSAVSSPRIVLEYALKDAGVKVTEDTSDFKADVVMTDLKGLSNLIPSLSSGQVELWAGPVPHPQNAEAQEVGKIIATLDELPGGKWVDFPCCTMNVHNDLIEAYPEIVQALAQVTTDIHNFAQNNREETADILASFLGLEREVLFENDTTYSTVVNENFNNGMRVYYEAMTEMGKFTGQFSGKEFDEIKDTVFDFSFVESVN